MSRLFRSLCLLLAGTVCISLLSDCGKKGVPVLRVIDADKKKLIVLTGDETKLHNFYTADFVILGGSLGGIAAALAICSSGRTAILVEETDRIAGCFTVGDTSAYAENRFIETSGSSKSYKEFRRKIQEWYDKQSKTPPELFKNLYPQLQEFGAGGICFESEAALEVVYDMLEDRIKREYLTVIKRHKVAKIVTYQNHIASLVAVDLDSLTANQFIGWMYIDATRTGDLFPLLGLEYEIGRESRADTNEPHAPDTPDSLFAGDVYCFSDPGRFLGKPKESQRLKFDLVKGTGAPDTLNQCIILRDSRRLRGRKKIVEQDISADFNKGPRAQFFNNSIGIGYEPIHIMNPGSDPEGQLIMTKPFQIPLGALLPEKCTNLIACGGNISTTWITSTAYSTPPVEWAVGEAAGIVAAYCAGVKTFTDELTKNPQQVSHIQRWLVTKRGAPIYWYDDMTSDDKDFVEAQLKPFVEPGYNDSSTTLHYRK